MTDIRNTGLVLEGGGFRAIFVAAALEVLHKHELFFSYMIGVSAGAAYGVSYATRQRGRNLDTNKFINHKRYCGIKHLIKNGDYFNWEFIYKVIPDDCDQHWLVFFAKMEVQAFIFCFHQQKNPLPENIF